MKNSLNDKRRRIVSGLGRSIDYEIDHDGVLDHKDELRAIEDRIHSFLKSETKTTLDIGVELEAARAFLKHGQFTRWVKIFSFTVRSAQQKMAAARFVQEKGEIFSHLPITALYALAEQSTPIEVLETVRARLDDSELLRAREVKNLIEDAKARKRWQQDAAVPGGEASPPCDEDPAVRQMERSQSAEAMAAPTESTVASIEQTESEPERAEPPTAQLSPPQQATDFSLELAMRQLIEVLMDVSLGSKSITEHAQTITGLLTSCQLEILAEQLTNYLQGTARAPAPAASDHVTVVSSSPPSDDRRANPANEGSAGAAEPDPEHPHAPKPSTAQPEPAEPVPAQSGAVRPAAAQAEFGDREMARPPAALPTGHEETAFSWVTGACQLIDRLMAVALTVEGEIPEETAIQGLLKFCSLDDHVDRLLNRPQNPIDKTQPAAAEKTQEGQSPTPALRDHEPAEVNHPLNRVWIDWGPTALKKYRTAEAGTKLWFAVQKKADGHARIMYQSDHGDTNARTDSTRRGK
jgi:hypothetical protein